MFCRYNRRANTQSVKLLNRQTDRVMLYHKVRLLDRVYCRSDRQKGIVLSRYVGVKY